MELFNTRQKIALARIAYRMVAFYRRARGLPLSGLIVRKGLNWQLNLSEGIDFSIFLLGAFEPETVRFYEKLIKPGDVVLDIGANIGAHTLHFARAVGEKGVVHAFEPTQYAFQKLTANVAANPGLISIVHLHQTLLAAATDASLPDDIHSSWPLESEPGLHKEHLGKLHSTAGARVMTLDEAARDFGMSRADFLKLDVDGHELPVLQGGARLLQEFRPPILIELCPHICAEAGYTFAELVDYLTEKGYRFFDFHGQRLPDAAIALEKQIPANGSINVLARSTT